MTESLWNIGAEPATNQSPSPTATTHSLTDSRSEAPNFVFSPITSAIGRPERRTRDSETRRAPGGRPLCRGSPHCSPAPLLLLQTAAGQAPPPLSDSECSRHPVKCVPIRHHLSLRGMGGGQP